MLKRLVLLCGDSRQFIKAAGMSQLVSEPASLPVRCGSGTNQAEAGGHVGPGASLISPGVDAGALRHDQGAAPRKAKGEGSVNELTSHPKREGSCVGMGLHT